MFIFDSRVHIWENAGLGPPHRQVATFSKDDILREMDEAGVDAAVIHPPTSFSNANEIAVTAPGSILTALGYSVFYPPIGRKAGL
jgi:hypothetical protein